MSEWITDRRPTDQDADVLGFVWNSDGGLSEITDIIDGEPWMPTNRPKPYVKPKRFRVKETRPGSNEYAVYGAQEAGQSYWHGLLCSPHMPTREAAERIAAIYEEVMP